MKPCFILSKKTVDKYPPFKGRLVWHANDSSFTGGGKVPLANTVDKDVHPLDPQLGYLPSMTLDLAGDGVLYLSAKQMQIIINTIRDNQDVAFVARMADVRLKTDE